MSTFTATGVPASRRSTGLRIFLSLLFLAVLLVGSVLGYAYFVARSALPQLDGKLPVKGLSAPVKVTRDAHGVPTIEAASLEDLFFAQGYVTAQDRLWQMDVMRRFGSGELSEILGEDTLKIDREQRVLGLRAAAKKSVGTASPRDQSYFNAYARGVNAFVASHENALPVEFHILKYRPKPWQAEDSIVIANQMVKDLNFYRFEDTLEREKVLAKLGPELTADLYVNKSWHDRPPTVMREDVDDQKNHPDSGDKDKDRDNDDDDEDSGPDNAVTKLVNGLEIWAQQAPEAVNGSNDWVVSGAHTVTGKPLLSNDMHLGHQMPNLWYEAHLRSGGLDVAGVTLPGMPYVIVGHNQRIAWGFTNVGPTVADAFIENFNSDGAYQTPQGWKQPEHRQEVIHVKGQPDVTIDVKITRHGPIISGIIPGESRQVALRWTLYDGLRMPFFDVDTAQNWQDFRKAFSQLDAPGQNVVYADVDGNIGFQTTGHIPIRSSGDGSLPVSGADDAHEWTSYIPFDKLPSIYNPPSGVIATANARITPDDYPYSISAAWEAPWRTARIYHVLESGRKFAASDMLALQNDVQSENDLFAAERFVYAVDHAAKPSARAKQAADLMRNWDGRMVASSTAATVAVRSGQELTRLLLEPRLGAASEDPKQQETTLSWKTYHWQMKTVWLQNVMLHQPKRWLPDKYHNYDELLTAAVEAAVSGPDAPKDLASWRWGRVNSVDIEHPVLGKIPGLQRWSAPGIKEQSGSGYTVKAVTPHHGPSERFTANLADLDQSTLNTVTGQGGNFLSPYYMDQWKAWYEGFTFTLPFTEKAVEATRAHRLVLLPAQ
ncbi:MAG TPA: penicillin acylase family protein [Candidatus Deferrimicrobiaceae bacterium]|nr:penicillin acylase family protein [Candidatus Deferrimicrobiaceae bacterium]